MTAKEKAKDLYSKYEFVYIQNYTSKHEVKQCAIIAVDELINDCDASSPFEEERLKYWEKVKEQIEAM